MGAGAVARRRDRASGESFMVQGGGPDSRVPRSTTARSKRNPNTKTGRIGITRSRRAAAVAINEVPIERKVAIHLEIKGMA